MLAYTGAVVDRYWGKAVFDLGGMDCPVPMPILFNHDGNLIVGHATSAEKTDEGLVLEGIVSDKTEKGREVIDLAGDGFPWTCSVGLSGIVWEDIEDDQLSMVNGVEIQGPIAVGRRSHCFETSYISAGPADKSTSAEVMRDQQPTKEGPMTPEEFLAANPAAVQAWKEEGRLSAVKSLSRLSGKFQGRTALCVEAWIAAGGEELAATAGMAELLHQQMSAAGTQQPAAPAQAPQAPSAENPQHAELREQGMTREQGMAAAEQLNAPGVGFNGPARETSHLAQPQGGADFSQLPLEERMKAEWDASAELRAQFGGHLGAYKATRKRELARLAVEA